MVRGTETLPFLVTDERTRAWGIFYLQRKPHPEAAGERLFVILTCEPLLLKRNLVPGKAQLWEQCFFMLNSCVRPANHESTWTFLASYFHCNAPLRPSVSPCEAWPVQNSKACLVKKRGSMLSPFICSLYLFINLLIPLWWRFIGECGYIWKRVAAD